MKLYYVSRVLIITTIVVSWSYNAQRVEQWQGAYYNDNSEPQYRVGLDALSRVNIAHCKSVLDIGCGSGKITHVISGLAPQAYIEAIDASENMINVARKRYNKLSRLHFNVRNAQDINTRNKYDLIVSFSCVHWIKDKESVFKAIAQALKPGGALLIVGTAKSLKDPLIRSFIDLKKKKPWSKFLSKLNYANQFFPLEKATLKKLFITSGLKPLEIKEIALNLCFKNKKAFARWVVGWCGGLSTLAQLAKDKQQAFINAVIDQYTQYVPVNPDGSVNYRWDYIEAQAQKVKIPVEVTKKISTLEAN